MAELVVGGVGEECLELGLGEVADLVVALLAGLVDRGDGVTGAPAAFDCVGEDGVEEAEVVEDALDRAAVLSFGADECLDVFGGDLVEGPVAEVGEEVDAQERLVVGEGARLQPDRLPVREISSALPRLGRAARSADGSSGSPRSPAATPPRPGSG